MNTINKSNLPLIDYRELKPLQGSLKDLSEENYGKLLKSIRQEGFFIPAFVWFDKDTPYIMDAHQRQRVLIRENIKFDNTGYEIPYVEVEAKDIKDAANKLLKISSQYGTITQEGLDSHIAKYELNEAEVYEANSFDALTSYGDDEDTEIEEDEAPEVSSEPPVSKLGEVYQLGRHRIMCADSTVKENVEQLMDGVKADMVFTDPPYGVSFSSNRSLVTAKFDVLKNDDVLLTEWVEIVKDVCNGFIFVWTTWKVYSQWEIICSDFGTLSNVVIWNKGGGGIGDLERTFSTDYEMALVYNQGNKLPAKRIGTVWDIGKDSANVYEHPTQKPVALAAYAIRHTTTGGDNVLDVFGGSGSTMVACHQIDRTCFMSEIDPRYVDVIIKRMLKLDPALELKCNDKIIDKTPWLT